MKKTSAVKKFRPLLALALICLLAIPTLAMAQQGNQIGASLSEEDAADIEAETEGDAEAPLQMQGEVEATPGFSKTITSVSSCLKLLPESEAATIRLTSLKPYEECQKRLLKLRDEKDAKAETAEEVKNTPETYKNYVRVSGTGVANNADYDKEEKAAPKSTAQRQKPANKATHKPLKKTASPQSE